MSLFFNRGQSATELVNERTGRRTNGIKSTVSRDKALRNSAVWGCLRLRADLISSMPIDIFRRYNGVQIEQAKPPVFVKPGGKQWRWDEFVYATQWDLDSVGNTVGVIKALDGLGLPALIELVPIDDVTFRGKGSTITKVLVGRTEYDYSQIWHETQYRLAGSPVGLSPIAYAARVINSHLSAQEFASEWFDNSTVPGGHLKNNAKTLNKREAAAVKENFKATVQSGDVWVSGMDWEYSMLSAKASESQFLELMEASVVDVCRFLGVPGDMIDAPSKGSSVTYANITQRNLQLLITNLGPAVDRREKAWTAGLLPEERYAKLNPNALLRMDLKSRYESYEIGVKGRWLPPSRILDLENMPPLTLEEEAEFARLFPQPLDTPKEKQLAELVQKIYLGVGTVISSEEARVLLEQAGFPIDGDLPKTEGE